MTSLHRSQTMRTQHAVATAAAWSMRRPLFTAPGAALAIALLLVADYPAARIAGVAATYLALLAFQIAEARRIKREGQVDPAPFRSWLVVVVGHTIPIALTGGMLSPFAPALLASLVVGYNLFGRGPACNGGLGFIAGLIVVLTALPQSIVGPPMSAPYGSIAIAVTLLVSAVMTRSSSFALNDAMRSVGETRDRLREDILQTVTARARSLESIGATVAHELKNPLSAIKGLVQLLARGSSDERARKRLEVIASEVTRMEAILRDYLGFSRPLEELRPEPTDTGAVTDEVLAVLEARAGDAEVALSRKGVGPTVVADPRRLKEALLNLVANAIEATPPGGSVDVVLAKSACGVEIVVRDTGQGLDAVALARIGTPFFTTREQGTGLGVVLAKSAIVQHGGEIHYASEPGRGTTVTVRLPAKPCCTPRVP